MKTKIQISAILLRAAKRVAKRDGTSVGALAEHRETGPFKLHDASVDGDGLQPGMDGLPWEAQRALAYGESESPK